jgi:hypothetical protein
MTTESAMEFLRNFKPRYHSHCPICRCLRNSLNCRQSKHFGMRWDYELERAVLRTEEDSKR